MPRGKRGPKAADGESKSGWFRNVFTENPGWLKGRSNELVVARWEAEHSGRKFGPSERNACNNIKSILRKQLRKRGRKAAVESGGAPPAVKISRANLEMLEERIDECMGLARSLDRDGLAPVWQTLRKARNEVVWKQGQ